MHSERLAAIWGMVVGTTLGASLPKSSRPSTVQFYNPVPVRMAPCEDLDAWWAWSQGGTRPANWRSLSKRNVFSESNLRQGIQAPLSGELRNPLSTRNGGLLRAAYWGFACAGNPEAAAERARTDASADRTGDIVEDAVALARTIAAWLCQPAPEPSPITDIQEAYEPPAEPEPEPERPDFLSLLWAATKGDSRAALRAVLDGHTTGPQTLLGQLGQSISAGKGTFEGTLLYAAGLPGDDKAELCGLAGLVGGLLGGEPSPRWLKPLGQAYVASMALIGIDPPETLGQFVATVAEPKEPSPLGVFTEVHFESPPVVGESFGGVLSLSSSKETDVHPEVTVPEGWEFACRIGAHRLVPGTPTKFPFVVRANHPGQIQIKLGEQTVALPAFEPMRVYLTGPFPFVNDLELEKALRPEDSFTAGATFMARGQMPCKWEEHRISGFQLNLETQFIQGQGVVYLAARPEFPAGTKLTLVVAFSPGIVVKWNHAKTTKHFETHDVIPEAQPPYVSRVEATGDDVLMIKLIRKQSASSLLTLYFLDERGDLIMPTRWLPIKP